MRRRNFYNYRDSTECLILFRIIWNKELSLQFKFKVDIDLLYMQGPLSGTEMSSEFIGS